MSTDRPLLTVREQQFYAFLRKFRGKWPTQAEMARRFNVQRQRIHQLLGRLKEKGYINGIDNS